MCEVIDNGKTRIVNKGADVAVITSSDKVAEAMKASRTLVVKGISTAIIEVLTIEPLDKETFISFAKRTRALVFLEKKLRDAVVEVLDKDEPIVIEVIEDPTVQNIIATTTTVIKHKLSKQQR